MYLKNICSTFFSNVDISLIMHDTHLKLYVCIENNVVEVTISQILYIRPGSFSIRYRKKIYKKEYLKSCPFLAYKI